METALEKSLAPGVISYPRALLDIRTGPYDKTVSQVSVNPGVINILASSNALLLSLFLTTSQSWN